MVSLVMDLCVPLQTGNASECLVPDIEIFSNKRFLTRFRSVIYPYYIARKIKEDAPTFYT